VYTCATMSLHQHGSLGMGVTDGLNMAERIDRSVKLATCILFHRKTVFDRDLLISV
jgi:hypothetical protein